jgi:dCTP deaminase
VTLLHHEALDAAMRRPEVRDRLILMPLLDRGKQIGPASLDLRLGTEFLLLRRTERPGLDPGTQVQQTIDAMTTRVDVAIGDCLWLHPGQFVLGATLEFIQIPRDLGAYVVGRSSWGRDGLLVATAIFVQPGFAGCLTLELVNHGETPIALYPGSRIGQLAVHALPSETEHHYGRGDDKYVGPTGPQVSHLAKEAIEVNHLKAAGELLEPGRGSDASASSLVDDGLS